MPRIVSLGTAVPPYCFSQGDLREAAKLHFKKEIGEIERLISVFDNVQVQRRFFCVPLEWLGHNHSFSEKNDQYIHWTEQLSVQAIENCLEQTEVSPEQVDHLVFVSNSGMSTPSIDARLANRLRLNNHIKRTPIFGLGCAGGAAGLSRCHDLAKGNPRQRILLVSVEISSLTFQPGDFRRSNLIASALFSDGAAAVLICGQDCPEEGTEIVDTQSTLWPETLGIMGWEFGEFGLRVVFAKSIPRILQKHLRSNVERFLDHNRINLRQLSHFVVHPGGAKILASFQESLGIPAEILRHSRFVLENYGNMSSPTVMFILDHLLKERLPKQSDYGLCAAFGPGFSSELLLLRW